MGADIIAKSEKFEKSRLPNGLRLVTYKVPNTRSMSIGIFLAAGSRYEGKDEAGSAHFVEHMMFKGTQKRRTSREISEAIEGIGGVINGGTDKEMTVFWCKVLREHFEIALDVLLDILFHSRFDPEDIEREKPIILEEIKRGLDMPAERASQLLDEILFPNHPLGRDVAGQKETISDFKREDLLSFVSRHYIPQNAVVAIAGDIEHKQAREKIEPLVSFWSGMPSSHFLPAPEPMSGPQVKVEGRDIAQANLCLGFRGLSYAHPDRFSLDLLNIILGAGMSSRLFMKIREERGLAYQILSYPIYFRDAGSLIIFAGVDPRRISEALSAILGELVHVKDEGVTDGELEKARSFYKGRMYLRLEDTRNVINWLGVQEIMEGRILTPQEIEAIISKITVSELREIANKIISRDRLCLAIVGPVSADDISI